MFIRTQPNAATAIPKIFIMVIVSPNIKTEPINPKIDNKMIPKKYAQKNDGANWYEYGKIHDKINIAILIYDRIPYKLNPKILLDTCARNTKNTPIICNATHILFIQLLQHF